MPQARAKAKRPPAPKSSTARKMEAVGQLTQPQKTATRPMAALKPAGSPRSGPITQPKVAPMKKEGTTSPPLKPAPRVRAVKAIFQRKAVGWAWPCSTAARTMSIPAPL